jgi:serine protease inhibitor
LAARIFASARFPLNQAFLNDTKNVFDAEAENIDFAQKQAAADRINQWVTLT